MININGKSYAFDAPETFALLTELWLKTTWDTKYAYSFTWLGRPIFQLPDDILRLQELIFSVKPDVIIETGVARGGSLIFYASLCKLLDKGRVIGIDIKIREADYQALHAHPLSSYVTFIKGNSVDSHTLSTVKSLIKPTDSVLIFLDASHQKEHVLKELEVYSPLVSLNSYIVTMDSIMAHLDGCTRFKEEWK